MIVAVIRDETRSSGRIMRSGAINPFASRSFTEKRDPEPPNEAGPWHRRADHGWVVEYSYGFLSNVLVDSSAICRREHRPSALSRRSSLHHGSHHSPAK